MLKESTDDRVLWRVRKTVYQMLRDRGYEVSDDHIEQTWEDFQKQLANGGAQNLNFLCTRPDPDSLYDHNQNKGNDNEDEDQDMSQILHEQVYVGFLVKEEKLAKDQLNKIVNFMSEHTRTQESRNQEEGDNQPFKKQLKPLEHAILILKSGVTSIGRKAVSGMDPFVIETFIQEELLVNVTHHELVPKHSVLTSQEKTELLKRYRAKESQLPKIQCEDPIARYFGTRRNQVMKIVRPSETAGRYVTYRVAV